VNIKPAGPEHYSTYCDLVAEFDQFFARQNPRLYRAPINPVRTEIFYASLFGPNKGILMAFDGPRAVGALDYYVEPPAAYPMLVPRKTFFVTIVMVTESRRRQGIATALLAEAKRKAAGLGCEDMDLLIQEFNEAAEGFYRSLGFKCRDKLMTLPLT
jgi:GNAT superfamily N-acetyltransferase